MGTGHHQDGTASSQQPERRTCDPPADDALGVDVGATLHGLPVSDGPLGLVERSAKLGESHGFHPAGMFCWA